MLTEPAIVEVFSFLGAILLAATVSATARGLSGSDDKSLQVFRKFYVDLVGAFAGIALLSAGGPTSWASSPMLANITSLKGAVSLLPIAVGLLLIGLLIARHRWGPRTRRVDLLVTLLVAAVIVVAVMGLTSRPTTAHRFDRVAQRTFSSYCAGHASDLTEMLELAGPLLDKRGRPQGEDRANRSESAPEPTRATMRIIEETPLGGTVVLQQAGAIETGGVSKRTMTKVKGEFCNAVAIYLTLRSSQG